MSEATAKIRADLETEYQRLSEVVLDAIEGEPGAQAAAAELVEQVRELASGLCIKAGAGDRFDDPIALVTVVTLCLMNSNGTAGLTLIESRDTSDDG